MTVCSRVRKTGRQHDPQRRTEQGGVSRRAVCRLLSCRLVPLLLLLAAPAARAAAAEFISPSGGEVWSVGSYHLVRWDADAIGNSIDLLAHYSTNAGQTWTKISSVTLRPAQGVLRWKVPGPPRKSVRLRISNPASGVTVSNTIAFEIRASQAVNNYQWTNVTSEAPYAPRDGAGALTFNNQMFLLGGWHPGNKKDFPMICNNEVWSSTDGKHWTLVKRNTHLDKNFDRTADWEGRHTGGYVVYRDKMWLVGGDTNQGHYQTDIWNSSDGKTWTLVNPGQPPPWGRRALHHTVVYKDKIWVMGGQTMPAFAPSSEAFYRDIWTTTNGKDWTQIQPRAPYWSPRGMIGGSVVFNGRLWILGGGTYDTPTTKSRKYFNDVWSTEDGVIWKQHLARAPWPARQYHHVTVYDDRMWVLAGYNAGDRDDVWYSRDGTNWYRQFGTPWQRRHAASVFVHDGSLWMAAGSCMRRDVWRLERSRDPDYRAAVEPAPLVSAVVTLDGLPDRKGFLFDSKHPNGSPDAFQMLQGKPTHILIYAERFGINYLDDQGQNAYADMQVLGSGDIQFVKWRDGGGSNAILVDNKQRPRRIVIRRK